MYSRIQRLRDGYWERCRFCTCGADNLIECECEVEKKERFRKRRKRKINEKIGKAPYSILLLSRRFDADIDMARGLNQDKERKTTFEGGTN